jgi:S-adenosylmethionine hydrolase
VDRFGNCVTNLDPTLLAGAGWALQAGPHQVRRLAPTYAAAPDGEPVLVQGSAGRLEIALKRDSAATRLGLRRGMPLQFTPDHPAPAKGAS